MVGSEPKTAKRHGPIPLSVVVMTRNAAPLLERTLPSLVGRFDQVVVADSASDDGTAGLARNLGAEVVDFRWSGRYPKKKQWSLSHPALRHDRVLFVDADECLPPAAIAELSGIAATPSAIAAWRATLRPVFAGRCLRFGRLHAKLVLLDRRRCRFDAIDDLDAPGSWEVEGHYQPTVDGPVAPLRECWVHDVGTPHDWFQRHERYARSIGWMEAHGRPTVPSGEHQPWRRALIKRVSRRMPGRTVVAFLDSYVVKHGWLEGRCGLDWALARAWYYWRIGLERRSLERRASPETRYHES